MKSLIWIISSLLLVTISYGQSARVVGYLPTYCFYASTEIEYCMMTHLYLAFANPDSAGNLQMEDFSQITTEEVEGIMIWEIAQDSFDEYALLSKIHDKFTSLGITATGLCGNEKASEVIITNSPG